MKEFMYCFQISKLIVFEVEYYTLGNNKTPYFFHKCGGVHKIQARL